MSLIQEFKEFALKGNAVDMAVGIIVGVAFNSVVQSLVNDIAMPVLGYLIGGVDFSDLRFILKEGSEAGAAVEVKEVAIMWGKFINTVINFLIVAWTVFIVIKLMNRVTKRRPPAAA